MAGLWPHARPGGAVPASLSSRRIGSISIPGTMEPAAELLRVDFRSPVTVKQEAGGSWCRRCSSTHTTRSGRPAAVVVEQGHCAVLPPPPRCGRAHPPDPASGPRPPRARPLTTTHRLHLHTPTTSHPAAPPWRIIPPPSLAPPMVRRLDGREKGAALGGERAVRRRPCGGSGGIFLSHFYGQLCAGWVWINWREKTKWLTVLSQSTVEMVYRVDPMARWVCTATTLGIPLFPILLLVYNR